MNTRNISIAAVFDGSDHICTVPVQIEKFVIKSLHFRFTPVGGGTRTFFVKIVYAGIETIFEIETFISNLSTDEYILTGLENAGYYEQASAGPLTRYTILMPLPDRLTLNYLSKITFGAVGTLAGDSITGANVMLEFQD